MALKELIKAFGNFFFSGPPFPDSCVADKIQHFVGRQEECKAILEHLIDKLTRIVAIYGPPGYGKTSLVITVAHLLREMGIPVYLISLRGMKHREELVSTLLSIFAEVPNPQMSAHDVLIGCLRQLKSRFVLMLDDADDFLESGDAKLREEFLRFVEQILERCSRIKLLIACHERLDCLRLKHSVQLVGVSELDRVASGDLVKLLLPDVSDTDCNCIVQVCGQVPLLLCLMCSFVTELNVSVTELLSASKISPLLNKALDDDSFCYSARPKVIVSTCIERLGFFLKSFGIDEAKIALNLKTEVETREKLGSLKRKSLIECNDDFETYKIHSVFRSIIEEKIVTDEEMGAVFNTAKGRYHLYKFGVANERNLTGRSNEALATFVDNREDIISSLVNGAKDDELFSTVVNVLAKAELLLFTGLRDELLFNLIYDTAIEEAKRRNTVVAKKNLTAAKSFGCYWGWSSSDHPTCDPFLQKGFTDAADCPAKLLCYYGVHQIHCGELEKGMSLLTSSVDRLSSGCDEKVLKELVYLVLAECHRIKQEQEMASHFENLSIWDTTPTAPTSIAEDDSLQNDVMIIVDDGSFCVTATNLIDLVLESFDGNGTAPVIDRPLQFLLDSFATFGRFHNSRGQLDAISVVKESKRLLEYRDRISQVSPIINLLQTEFEIDPADISFSHLDQFLSSQNPIERYNITKQMLQSHLSLLQRLTTDDLDRADTLNVLLCSPIASVVRQTLFVDSLKLFENVPGIDFEDLAGSYDTLGSILLLTKDYSGAQDSFQKGVRLREVNDGDPAEIISSLTIIGEINFKLNNEVEAEKAFQSALSLRKSLGVYDTANIYATLGECHFSHGNYNKALGALQDALQLREKHLGEHTLTAASFHEVGLVFFEMKDYESAKEAFHEARRMSRKSPGQERNTAIYCHHVARLYYELRSERNLVLARAFCQQALAPRLKLGNREMASRLHLLGCIHFAKGDLPSALQAFQKASRLQKETLVDHPDTASTFCATGHANLMLGDNTSAVNAFQEASRIRSNLLGDHEDTARTYHWLGVAQYHLGDINGAMESLQKAVRIGKGILPVDHPDTAESLKLLNAVYEALSVNELDCD